MECTLHMATWTFKTPKGRRWHTGAITYALIAYALGWTLLLAGGWTPLERWTDAKDQFSVLLARATDQREAP